MDELMLNGFLIAISIFLLVYLLVSLIFPERF